MIKVVFFDIDNTLLSFSEFVKETMKSGFDLFGLPPYRESTFSVFEKINNGLWRQIEEGTMSFAELLEVRWNLIFKELNVSFDGKTFEKYFRKQLFDSAILEPEVIETLDYLKGRYTLCIVSNGFYEQQINRLRNGKLYDYFSYFFISGKINASKPTAEFFDFCFKELRENGLTDLLSEEVLIIGDSLSSDIAGGKAYGLKTCLYDKSGADGKEAESADYVITKLSDIKLIL